MDLNGEARLHWKLVELIKQLHVYLKHFPRHERAGITAQILTAAYDTYSHLAASKKPFNKKSNLNKLDESHERLRMLILLAHELGYFNWPDNRAVNVEEEAARGLRRFHVLSVHVDEVGRLIGGWRKKVFKDANQ